MYQWPNIFFVFISIFIFLTFIFWDIIYIIDTLALDFKIDIFLVGLVDVDFSIKIDLTNMLTFDMDISFDGMCVSIYLILHNFLLVIGIINLLIIVKCVQINRTLTLVIIFISSNRPTNPVR